MCAAIAQHTKTVVIARLALLQGAFCGGVVQVLRKPDAAAEEVRAARVKAGAECAPECVSEWRARWIGRFGFGIN